MTKDVQLELAAHTGRRHGNMITKDLRTHHSECLALCLNRSAYILSSRNGIDSQD
jgi:hypothetical protein